MSILIASLFSSFMWVESEHEISVLTAQVSSRCSDEPVQPCSLTRLHCLHSQSGEAYTKFLDPLDSCAYMFNYFLASGDLSSADNVCKQFGPRSGPTMSVLI